MGRRTHFSLRKEVGFAPFCRVAIEPDAEVRTETAEDYRRIKRLPGGLAVAYFARAARAVTTYAGFGLLGGVGGAGDGTVGFFFAAAAAAAAARPASTSAASVG